MVFASSAHAGAPDPVALVRREEDHIFGKSLSAKVTMLVDPDGISRTLEFRFWSRGFEKSLIKILKPVKDLNVGNLKLGKRFWQFLPKIDQVIMVPESMMLQSWMGSDFTNDDLVKASRLSSDYSLKMAGESEISGKKVYVIEATPKPGAVVVWGKIIEYLTRTDSVFVKRELYDDKKVLVKVLTGSDWKTFGGHTIATTLTMTNQAEGGRRTIMKYTDVEFDKELPDSTFTHQRLRRSVY